MLKWGEKEDGLDRVEDMNSGSVKECLQVKPFKDVLRMNNVDQGCNDEKLNLVTSSSSYPSPITMPNRLIPPFKKITTVFLHLVTITNQGGLLPGGEQGEDDLQGGIPKHRLREAPDHPNC